MHTRLTVVAIAAAPIQRRLVSVLPQTVICHSWADVDRTIEASSATLLFVDPTAFPNSVESVIRLRERSGSTSFVLYAKLDGESVQNVTRLARAGLSDLVVFGYDDSPERLRGLVEEAMPYGPVSLVSIEPALRELPPRLRLALATMFNEPRRFRSTEDVAVAAEMSVRATFRHLRKAGFVSPRLLVASARVLRAHQLLATTTRSATAVAYKLGYRSVDQLSQHLTELADCTASHIRKGEGPADFDAVVLKRLIKSVDAPAATPQGDFVYAHSRGTNV
jgi:AraC-like DNA-binding protein